MYLALSALPIAVVLAFAVAAVLAGADSVTAVTEWAQDAPPEVLQALDARRDRRGRRVLRVPSTFRRLLRVLDAGAVAAAFGTWLKAQVTAGLADTTALPHQDGAGPQETPPGPLLTARLSGHQVVINGNALCPVPFSPSWLRCRSVRKLRSR